MQNKNILLAIIAPSLVASSLAAYYKLESSKEISSLGADIEVLKNELEDARSASKRLLELCETSNCAREIETKLARADSLALENRKLTGELDEQKVITASLKQDNASMQTAHESELNQLKGLYASDMQSMERTIRTMDSNYQELADSMEDRLEQEEQKTQEIIRQKEREFEEIHRRSINNVIGKIDSLAKRKVSEIIPLISNYSSREINETFICGDQSQLTPNETIFSKFINQHWLTWEVAVEKTDDGISHGVTKDGDHVIVHWENPENLYDFGDNEPVTVQFQLGDNLECGNPLEISRAVISTT